MSLARTIRSRMLTYARPNERVAVALSGGVDSCAVLAALLHAGGQSPVVISYTPDTHESTDFQMARQTAENLGLRFVPAIVKMDPTSLERYARLIVGYGFKKKVQVESLAPMLTIARVAAKAGATHLYTGDQADGYFALSKWAAHNLDRSLGVPYRQRSRSVKEDADPLRIDLIRMRYYDLDLACTGAIAAICKDAGVRAVFPFRDERIRRAFIGTLWSDINRPRIKEPIRAAWEKELAQMEVRPVQVNLHKGDSRFGDTMGAVLAERFAGQGTWKTTTGLYAALARGEL